ncbi:MAG: dienelactone hydrolase family protein [Marivibrio sp.]|uniref:dienelactone hydrolase family protein n=1 Tax=Marivibrio sp. TaxID=2039719 RepID=UPI0032EF1E5C
MIFNRRFSAACFAAFALSACQTTGSGSGAGGGEEISFQTYTPDGYVQILDGSYTGEVDEIDGVLRLPEGAEGPVPAVILMHGSGGIRSEIEGSVSDALLEAGFAAFIVDSFSGRGLSSTGRDQGKLPIPANVVDGLQALKALRQRPEIDPERVGITGFSRGGIVAMYDALAPIKQAILGDAPPFAAYAPVYPGCAMQWDTVKTVGGPIHFFLGAEDDQTPAANCEITADRMRAQGAQDVSVTVYPDASHQFLIPRKSRVSTAATFADCQFEIRDSGLMVYEPLDITSEMGWGPFVRTVFKDCGKRGFTRGGTPEVRAQALADITAFFTRTLKGPTS